MIPNQGREKSLQFQVRVSLGSNCVLVLEDRNWPG